MFKYIILNYKNFIILFSLYGFLLISLLIFIYVIPQHQDNYNRKVLSYKVANFQPEKMPNVDPFFDTLVSYLEFKNYRFDSEINSEEVEAFLKESTNISQALNGMKFRSTVDILSYFTFRRENKIEMEVVAKLDPTTYDADLALAHVDNTYIQPISACLSMHLYEKPSFLSEQAFLILRSIDTQPNSDARYNVNRILLAKALFEYPNNTVKDYETIRLLYKIMMEGFNPLHESKLMNINSLSEEVVNLKKYWQAVYHFRSEKFTDAVTLLAEIRETTNNFILRYLTIFMEARCLFWHSRANWESLSKEDRNELIEDLKSYSQQLNDISSLKTDVDFYINEVRAWGEAPIFENY